MRSQRGFTLIELVVILVILAILAAVIESRMPDYRAVNASAFADKLRADIRYAQSAAMTGNRRTRVHFNGSDGAPNPGYAVVTDASAGGNCGSFSPLPDPAGGGSLSVALGSGMFSGISVAASAACLEFDSRGTPYSCAAFPASCSTAPGGMTADVNGDPTLRVAVTAGTGAVN